MEDRLIRLEDRLAFAERDVETLSQVVRELADALDAARREIRHVRDDLARGAAGGGHDPQVPGARDPGRSGAIEGGTDETDVPRAPGHGVTDAGASGAPDEDLRRHLPPHWGRRPSD